MFIASPDGWARSQPPRRFEPIQRRYGKSISKTAAAILYEEILRFEGVNTVEHNIQRIVDSQVRLEELITTRVAVLEAQNETMQRSLELVKTFLWALIDKQTLKIPASDVLAMAVTELMETMPEAAKPRIRAILKDIIGPPANEQPDN